VSELALGVLARPESIELLRKHRPDLAPDDAVLNAIAAELGGLPLALHLAGSFLARYRHAPPGNPQAYLEAVRRPDLLDHRSLTIEGASPTGHAQHVARTFALSHDQLDPADAIDAMALLTLARAAWFAPGEPIARDVLRASSGVDREDETAILRFEDGLARLRELGLIAEQEHGTLVLHRLVAAFVRSQAAGADAHRFHVEAAVAVEAGRLNEAGYPGPLLAWQPQLRFVAERAAEAGSEHAIGLLNVLGFHLFMVADFVAAKTVFERALKMGERALGPDHPDVATLGNNLGNVLRNLGDLTGAGVAFERALTIGGKVYGKDHPQVATYANNLGLLLLDLHDLAGARAAFERALSIDEKNFGPDHPNVAIRVNNLGLVLLEMRDLAGARASFEQALGIDEASFGPDHPNVAIRVNNLGSVLRAQGDLEGARAAFERALQIGQKGLGNEHPDVVARINNVGNVLRELGDLAGARAHLERALSISEHTLGADHLKVAIAANSLGYVLRDLGDLADARTAFERAVAIFERVLGPDHPNTRAVRSNLESLGGH
jgi:tetratricopeptide (TPR) repeat protein